MILIKKKHYMFLLLVFLSWCSIASASLDIVKVEYDPEGSDTGREWVKLYNSGSEAITIIGGKSSSAWRFGDGEGGNQLHYINDQLVIDPGEYAILASDKDTFLSEYSFSSDMVADTSMSLNNSSGVVKIFDGSDPRNIVAISEYNSDDDLVADGISVLEEDDSTSSNSNDEGDESIKNIPLSLSAKITSPKIVYAGMPFVLDSTISNNRGEKLGVGVFNWSFGDGTATKMYSSMEFEHIYFYPGEYVLNLDYAENAGSFPLTTSIKKVIKVIPVGITISSVGDYTDPFIELENKYNYEIPMSGWIIQASSKYFRIPEGTIIMSNKKLKLSPYVTGFNYSDIQNIIIYDSSSKPVTNYPNIPSVSTKSRGTSIVSKGASSVKGVSSVSNLPQELGDNDLIIDLNNLGASAENSQNSKLPNTFAYFGLGAIVFIGITSIWLLRKKTNTDDDLESQIRAEDITIIE